jgi:hypothetical protein
MKTHKDLEAWKRAEGAGRKGDKAFIQFLYRA